MSEAVIHAVANAKGVDPIHLEPRLYDVVDPDALDSLFRQGSGEVLFEYAGFEVRVDADGNVTLSVPAN